MKECCLNCKDRKVWVDNGVANTCHSTCQKYKEIMKENDLIKKKREEEIFLRKIDVESYLWKREKIKTLIRKNKW